MDYETLRGALLNMAADKPGGLDCYGCGCEHNCQQEGCAILRDALATMEQLYKDASDLCDTCIYGKLSMAQAPCNDCKCSDPFGMGGPNSWQWRGVQQKEDKSDGNA